MTEVPIAQPQEWYVLHRCFIVVIMIQTYCVLLIIIHIRVQFYRKKYDAYSIDVDPDQDDRATEIKLCSFARPHMCSFHVNWFGFFMAFFIWFAIVPLMPEIKETLHLTKSEVRILHDWCVRYNIHALYPWSTH
jgi:hypothetical protein